jgi:hypothetical protein
VGLLDDDSKIITKLNEERDSGKKSKKSKTSGLNRFGSLNKYAQKIEEARASIKEDKKTEHQKPAEAPTTIEVPLVPHKQTLAKNIAASAGVNNEQFDKPSETVGSNKVQNKVQLGSEQGSNTVQTGSKTRFMKSETGFNEGLNEVPIRFDDGSNRGSEQGSKIILKEPDTDFRDEQKPLDIFKSNNVSLLTGNKKKVIHYFFEECKKTASNITPKFTREYLVAMLDIKKESLKTALHRLKKDNLIEVHETVMGRNGWSSYLIPNEIYKQLVNFESSTNAYKYEKRVEDIVKSFDDKVGSKQGSEKGSTGSSSSSTLNIYNSTSTSAVPEDWKRIKIPDSLMANGFSMTHITQIYSSRKADITAEEVQTAFNDFAYDLENKLVKAVRGPVSLFQGTMRKEGGLYISEALIKAEAAEINKLKKIAEQKRKLVEDRANLELSSKVDIIVSKMTDEFKRNLLPPKKGIVDFGSERYEMLLNSRVKTIFLEKGENYFTQNYNGNKFLEEIENL